jgi:hypothetical protein
MFVNRIKKLADRRPEPVPSLPTPGSFVALPFPWLIDARLAWPACIYQRAFEEAQAVVRPSLLERDLLGVWN